MRLSTSLRLNAQKGLVTPYDPTLTLSLQFATRQAYVSDFGPLPTFTNATMTARTFVGSDGLLKTAAINVPRIEFDPVTRQCLGLLIEEQRQTLTTWSEDATNSAWSKLNVTATGNTAVAPDGNSSADLIAETTANLQHYFYTNAATVTISVTYTASIFLKKGTGATAPDWVVLGNLGSGFGARLIAFNVSTGAFGANFGGLTGTVKQFPNGWWRVSFTSTATASGAHGGIYVGFTNNTNTINTLTYPGQTTSDILVWGAQFEAGSFASSYIPTTTTSLVRSADVCSITGAAFTGFWNASEGTLVFQGMKQALQTGISPTYLQVDSGSATDRLLLFNSLGTSETLQIDVGGVFQGGASFAGAAANTVFCNAFRYKLNDYAMSSNGLAVIADTNALVPTVSQMSIGNRLGSSFLSGWVRSIQYYNQIKTNAQLQALSTP